MLQVALLRVAGLRVCVQRIEAFQDGYRLPPPVTTNSPQLPEPPDACGGDAVVVAGGPRMAAGAKRCDALIGVGVVGSQVQDAVDVLRDAVEAVVL